MQTRVESDHFHAEPVPESGKNQVLRYRPSMLWYRYLKQIHCLISTTFDPSHHIQDIDDIKITLKIIFFIYITIVAF